MGYKKLKKELKELGCWKQFKANLKVAAKSDISDKEYIKQYKELPFTSRQLLAMAFVWEQTLEKGKYWKKIAEQLEK